MKTSDEGKLKTVLKMRDDKGKARGELGGKAQITQITAPRRQITH
jgi:hypothetical protein